MTYNARALALTYTYTRMHIICTYTWSTYQENSEPRLTGDALRRDSSKPRATASLRTSPPPEHANEFPPKDRRVTKNGRFVRIDRPYRRRESAAARKSPGDPAIFFFPPFSPREWAILRGQEFRARDRARSAIWRELRARTRSLWRRCRGGCAYPSVTRGSITVDTLRVLRKYLVD